jgi:hypothetical protein
MTTPTEVFLDLTQANGSEIVLDGFAPDSRNLPFINISGAIRLPGQGFAGLGQNGTSPWQPLELNATDIVDSRNNHIQGPAGSLQPKALGLRSSVVLAAYSVTLFDGTGVPGRQRVVPATANTALIANRIAGVCQQRLPGNTDDVSMHVTNGYTLVRVANPVANTDLPVPVFLTTVATQAGAVTSIAPTDPDSQQVRVGVLVQVFPSSQIEQYGLMRLELEKLR